MKTMILEGSARRRGRTAELVEFLRLRLPGEVTVVRAYDTPVSPCRDCRYCLSHPGCAVKDEMQDLYPAIEGCDNLIIASPLYFHSVPAPLKTIIDRLQPYWAATVRGDEGQISTKRGALLLVGGAPPFEGQFLPAELMLRGVLSDLHASCEDIIRMDDADRRPLPQRPEIQAQLMDLAQRLSTL